MTEPLIRRTKTIALLTLGAAVIFYAAYSYGRHEAKTSAVAPEAKPEASVFVGTIVGFDPPSVLVRSIWDREESTRAIIVDPHTRVLKLVPWEPGEREGAIRAFKDHVEELGLKKGDRVPPPPSELKPVPMTADNLVLGLKVAIGLDLASADGSQLSAAVIRPLTEKEIAEKGLSATFPY